MNETLLLWFRYSWRHYPTGKSGKRRFVAYSRLRALEEINKWNHSEDWKYLLDIADTGTYEPRLIPEFSNEDLPA